MNIPWQIVLRNKATWIVALVTVLACCWRAQKDVEIADRNMRFALLHEAVAVAQTINARHVAELTFTAQDAGEAVYQRICEQMRAFAGESPYKGFWSLGLRNGRLVFGPESYPAGSALSSPPGTLYRSPSDVDFAIFRNGQAYVSGPKRDEYGEFVYAAAPVLEPHTGNVVLAVGVDLAGAEWRRRLALAGACAALRTLPAGLILIFGTWLLRWRRRQPPERKQTLRHGETYIVAAFAVCITVQTAYESHMAEHLSQQNVFYHLASNQAYRLTAQIHQIRDNVLGALSDYYRSSDAVGRNEFESFAAPMLMQNGMFAVAWLERIPATERQEWEARARNEGYADTTIWEPSRLPPRIPASTNRPVLYPIRHSAQHKGGGVIVGLDEGSCPIRRGAIEESLQTGLTTATTPVNLISSDINELGVITFQPTYKGTGPDRTLLGLALVAFNPSALIQATIGPMPAEALISHITIRQLGQTNGPALLVAASEDEQPLDKKRISHCMLGSDISQTFPIFAFGRAYALTCTPGKGFMAGYPMSPAWHVLATGLAITGLLSLLTFLLIRRHSDLEVLVARRTKALRESENNYRLAEAREHYLNQMLLAIRNVNQLIVREQNPKNLLNAACLNLTETLGYHSAWIALLDDAGNVATIAASGPEETVRSLRERLTASPAKKNPLTAVWENGESVRLIAHPDSLPGADAMSDAELSARIEYEGHRYGILGIAIPSELAHEQMAVSLFTELADDLGFALHKIATSHELAESELRFRSLVDGAPDAIIVQTGETFAYLNQRATALLGAANNVALIGRKVIERFPAERHSSMRENMRQLIEEKRPVSASEETLLRLDGQTVDVEISAVPLRFRGQDAALIFARDISARKLAAEQNRKLEAQLHQSQKLESLGQLAGGVAHDFNNMLQVILGNTELLLQDLEEGSQQAETVREIRNAGQRSAELTRQLLAFARKQTIAPRPLDMNATIADQLRFLGRLIGEHLTLRWLPGDDLPLVKMDPAQLIQILTNLAVNARDAIAGNGTVTIETTHLLVEEDDTFEDLEIRPGHYVVISISDDGCGMDRETRIRIFEPFFTTKPTGKGTGLGLSTVYGIVRQCNGFINVYSEPGQGSTFRIYLPCSTETEAVSATKKDAPVEQARKETILVVEDEKPLLDFVCKLLKQIGFTVLAAKEPAEALRIAKAYNAEIDLLLTDVVMPDMSGRDLEQRLLRQRPTLRTLFMSGYTADVIAHHNVLDEGIQFLQKPFSSSELKRAIAEALNAPPLPASGKPA